MTAPQSILIISLGGAGDVLMATPLLRHLAESLPGAAIDVLVMQGAAARDVLHGNPYVRECLYHDFMRASKMASLRFCSGLRRRRYDVSLTVMPQNRFEYNLVSFLIGARRRLGFDFAIRCGALPRLLLTQCIPEDPQAHLIENNLRLASEGLGLAWPEEIPSMELFPTSEHEAGAEAFVETHGLRNRRLIGLHPGTGATKNLALRRWEPAKWAELVRRLSEDDRVTLVLLGSGDETALRQTIRDAASLPADRLLDAPAGSILDTAALMARLELLICCDTLLTHVAAAMGTPEVVIMGPTPHTSVYPWGVPHRIVRLGLSCSPCYGYSRHGIRCTHSQPMACLADIEAAQVLSASAGLSMNRYIDGSARPV
jgi:lipopolysaccharide heptosyltransferase II